MLSSERLKDPAPRQTVDIHPSAHEEVNRELVLYKNNKEVKDEFLGSFQRDLDIDPLIDLLPQEAF